MQQNIQEMAAYNSALAPIKANAACESDLVVTQMRGEVGEKLIKGQKAVAPVDDV